MPESTRKNDGRAAAMLGPVSDRAPSERALTQTVPTRDQFKQSLIEFINGPLSRRRQPDRRNAQVDGATPLFETGLIDSLGILDLLLFLETAIGRSIPTHMVDMKYFRTVDAICEAFWREVESCAP